MSWTTIEENLEKIKSSLETELSAAKAESSGVSLAKVADIEKLLMEIEGLAFQFVEHNQNARELTEYEAAEKLMGEIQGEADCVEKHTKDEDGYITVMTFSSATLGKKVTLTKSFEVTSQGKRCTGYTLVSEDL